MRVSAPVHGGDRGDRGGQGTDEQERELKRDGEKQR
jgi:hypothetical protein